MSVNLVHTGTIDGPYRVALDGTSVTDVTTAWTSSDKAKVAAIALANVDTSNAVFCKLFYHDGTNSNLFAIYDVAAQDTVIVDNLPISMKDGWKLQAQAETADKITVTAIMAIQPR